MTLSTITLFDQVYTFEITASGAETVYAIDASRRPYCWPYNAPETSIDSEDEERARKRINVSDAKAATNLTTIRHKL